jgi:hypothetical protein
MAGALFLHTFLLLESKLFVNVESDIALSKSMHSLAESADAKVQ